MVKGGYQIIDFKGIELSSTPVVFHGIYDLIEGNNKATMISGLYFDGVEYDDVYASFIVSSTDFVATVNGIAITVSDDDEVTAAEVE